MIAVYLTSTEPGGLRTNEAEHLWHPLCLLFFKKEKRCFIDCPLCEATFHLHHLCLFWCVLWGTLCAFPVFPRHLASDWTHSLDSSVFIRGQKKQNSFYLSLDRLILSSGWFSPWLLALAVPPLLWYCWSLSLETIPFPWPFKVFSLFSSRLAVVNLVL